MKLFSKEPDGRYVIENLVIIILVPLPFLLLIFASLREEFNLDYFIAFLGIILFWILWIPPVWKGAYYERIASPRLNLFYQFAANSLLFLYTSMFTSLIIFVFKDSLLSEANINSITMYTISLLISLSCWLLGGKIKNIFSPTRDRWSNKLKVDDHSPYAYLLRASAAFVALIFIFILSGFLYLFVK